MCASCHTPKYGPYIRKMLSFHLLSPHTCAAAVFGHAAHISYMDRCCALDIYTKITTHHTCAIASFIYRWHISTHLFLYWLSCVVWMMIIMCVVHAEDTQNKKISFMKLTVVFSCVCVCERLIIIIIIWSVGILENNTLKMIW